MHRSTWIGCPRRDDWSVSSVSAIAVEEIGISGSNCLHGNRYDLDAFVGTRTHERIEGRGNRQQSGKRRLWRIPVRALRMGEPRGAALDERRHHWARHWPVAWGFICRSPLTGDTGSGGVPWRARHAKRRRRAHRERAGSQVAAALLRQASRWPVRRGRSPSPLPLLLPRLPPSFHGPAVTFV